MLKKLMTIATILLLASCSSKVKNNEEVQSSADVKIEDKSADQNTYQSIADEQAAASLDQQTQAQIHPLKNSIDNRIYFSFR